ncbi:Vacuolar protein sorting-associated protein 17 [Microbotryomycetes sp. JL201]|nr:Vacuolar protein sorting-associated protein 17 [Microbotryomycetes sp. JL201]
MSASHDPLGYRDASGARHLPSTVSTDVRASAVRSVSPLSPRPPLPGQHQQQRSPQTMVSPAPSLSSAWGPTSPDRAQFRGSGGGVHAGEQANGRTDLAAGSPRPGMQPRSPFSNEFDNGTRRYAADYGKDSFDGRDGAHGNDDTGTITATSRAAAPTETPFLRIRIVGLDKNRRDLHIKFNAETNLATYRHSTYRAVSRSYTEFARLQDALAITCPQSIVPALPLAQTSAATEDEDDRLVKLSFQKWVARVTTDPAFLKDEELRSFVESDFGYTPHVKRKTSSGFHFSRSAKLPGERDDELTVAKVAMSRLETQFDDVAKSVEKSAHAHRKVAMARNDVADHLETLSSTETYGPLSVGIKRLAQVLKVTSDVRNMQSVNEQITLGDKMVYQAMNARSAKETLSSRDHIVEEHRAAVKTTISKRKAIEKIKVSNNIRPERVDEALDELEDARQTETVLAQRLVAISSDLQPSLQAHSRATHYDVLSALLDHARTNLLAEKQVLKEIELARPEMHRIQQPVAGVHYHSVPRGVSVPSSLDAEQRQRSPASRAPQSRDRNGGDGGSLYGKNVEDGTRSMFVSRSVPNTSDYGQYGPPGSMASPAEKRTVRSMASSVVVDGEQRQRVNARTAASLLANGF